MRKINLWLLCFVLLAGFRAQANWLDLHSQDYVWIADKIFKNEANRQVKYLTHWNQGESFPSFGIGHFIWLPENSNEPFVETFPEMLEYVGRTTPPPNWLKTLKPFAMPWKNRANFYQVWHEEDLRLLREWLNRTQALQAKFIVTRLQKLWQQKLLSLEAAERDLLSLKMDKLTATSKGLFAVIDYVNFKGLGANQLEQYRGKGWGLIDVLQVMPPSTDKDELLVELFVIAAKQTLDLRINNAPTEKNEMRWRKGWFKRLDGYL